jgi:aspartate/glutamate racemase
MQRIFLIHATRLSIDPITASFTAHWPDARLSNLMDDSLSQDLAAAGSITPAITQRFRALADYAAGSGATGILFTCSAFGPAIEECRAALSIPVLKPNEAMIEEALASGGKIGLLATFAPSLDSMANEFQEQAGRLGLQLDLQMAHVPDAMRALEKGDATGHDQLILQAAEKLHTCDLICFAQFSMARAAQAVANSTGRPVLTTPDSAVRKLRQLLKKP